jgi:amino acid permease
MLYNIFLLCYSNYVNLFCLQSDFLTLNSQQNMSQHLQDVELEEGISIPEVDVTGDQEASHDIGTTQDNIETDSQAQLIANDSSHDEHSHIEETTTHKKGSASGVLFNLINTTVGAGILALPYAFKELGIVFGVIALLIMGIIAGSTLHFLAVASAERKRFSYKELAIDVFGTKIAGVIFELTIVIVSGGALISYLIIIGQFSESLFGMVLEAASAPDWVKQTLGHRASLIAIVMLLIIFPLSSLRRIQFLSYSSLLSILSACFVVLAVAIKSIQGITTGTLPGSVALIGSFERGVSAFPIICFSLTSHVTLLPMIQEMKSPSVKKVSIVGALNVTICVMMYMTIAVFGYVLFIDNTQDNILNSFDKGDVLILIAKVFITFVVILSYPLFLYATRECFENVFFADKPFSWPRWLIETAIICIVTYIIAVIFPSIKSVLGLSGATGSTLAAFVYP